jgi:CDP-diacylglycerol--glycerol-3-phosphate 3-phosphatidyltransferase
MTKFWNTPNSITFARLIVAPVMLVLMLFLEYASDDVILSRSLSFAAAILFAVAMTSDMVDGYYARKYNLTSTFGKLLDPLADKLLFLTAMIMMIPLGRIPAWIVAILFVREVTITALRGIAVEEGIVIAASHWGKYKSAFISTATVGLLMHYPFFGLNWRMMAWIFLWPGLLLSIGSALHYTIGFFRGLTKQPA